MVKSSVLPNKRETLARLFDSLGLNRLTSLTGRTDRVLVLNYHRIGDPNTTKLDREIISATPAEFSQQLDYLANRFDVVSIDEALRITRSGATHRRPTVCITFDDGYADNATVAAPMLAERGLTATFFLATGFLGQPDLAWWDRLTWIVKHAEVEAVELPEYGLELSLDDQRRPHSIQTAISTYKALPTMQAEEMVCAVEEASGVSVAESQPGREIWMSWEQARQLKDMGMTLGGHTVSHPVLAQLDPRQQRDEVFGCSQQIEAETGERPRHFSYPVGQRNSFDDTTQAIVRAAGFETAFSFYGGLWMAGHRNAMDIPRVAVERTHDGPMFRSRTTWPTLFARH